MGRRLPRLALSARQWLPNTWGLISTSTGGEDHIPVHHTNEIAQSEACYRTRLANVWMHGYFLVTSGEKMAKSAGEFLRLQTLIDEGYDPLSYRYLCLNAHYRSRLNFNWEAMDGAPRR